MTTPCLRCWRYRPAAGASALLCRASSPRPALGEALRTQSATPSCPALRARRDLDRLHTDGNEACRDEATAPRHLVIFPDHAVPLGGRVEKRDQGIVVRAPDDFAGTEKRPGMAKLTPALMPSS
ncbi:hypothetical protein QP185_18230 [Sphingomonas aerolata]|uniref:hypothetical protein n=1 Tax=Sphingomonas aerolata TaxID=185951 RepID=UPI002FE2A965